MVAKNRVKGLCTMYCTFRASENCEADWRETSFCTEKYEIFYKSAFSNCLNRDMLTYI